MMSWTSWWEPTQDTYSSMPKPRILHPLMSWSIIKTEILNMHYLSILQMRMLSHPSKLLSAKWQINTGDVNILHENFCSIASLGSIAQNTSMLVVKYVPLSEKKN